MQVILDPSFARPGSAPIWGGKKGEFRDWTICLPVCKVTIDYLYYFQRRFFSLETSTY